MIAALAARQGRTAGRSAVKNVARRFSAQLMSTNADSFRDIVFSRRSCKRFQPEQTMDEAVLQDILEQTMRSPTGFNLQPYTIVLATSEQSKAALADACLGANGFRVRDAPVTAVFAADLEALQRVDSVVSMERAAGAPEGYLSSLPFQAAAFATGPLPRLASLVRGSVIRAASAVTPMPTAQSPTAWAYKQTMVAASTFMLSATSHGLASCAMEGFDSHRVARALDIPSRYEVPVIISIGTPHEADPTKNKTSPRFPLEDMVRRDTFATPYCAESR